MATTFAAVRPTAIKIKAQLRYPASFAGEDSLVAELSHGTVTIRSNYEALTPTGGIPSSATAFFKGWDSITGAYYRVSYSEITAGSVAAAAAAATAQTAAETAGATATAAAANAAASAAAAAALVAVTPLKNLIENSGMGLCSVLLPHRVGNQITISGWSTYPGAGSGAAEITCSGGSAGLTAGKLMLVEGATAPHVPFVGVSLTATLNKRLTGAAGTFTGVIVGNWFRLTGGTNTSPRLDYKIIATDGSTYVEIFGGPSGSILVNEAATYSMTWFAGPAAVNQTVNGYPAAPLAFFEAQAGCSLQVVALATNKIYASLSGWYGDALGTSAAIGWELVPGDSGYNSTDACDGWIKTFSLKYWRTYDKDWDGTTSVTLPGSMYGCKVQKGTAGTERLYKPMAQKGCAWREIVDPGLLAQRLGKKMSFGMWWWAPSASTARPFIFDGSTYVYGSYFVSGSFDWQEVTLTIPTGATALNFGVEITGASGSIHYGTQPMGVYGGPIGRGNYYPFEGMIYPTFHQHPVRYVASPMVSSLQNIRLEQETNGFIPRDCKAIMCDLEGVSSVPSSIFLMDSAATYVPSLILISQTAGGTYHVPGTQPIGKASVATPTGTFFSENLVLQPNTPAAWTSLTIDIVGYQF